MGQRSGTAFYRMQRMSLLYASFLSNEVEAQSLIRHNNHTWQSQAEAYLVKDQEKRPTQRASTRIF